MDTLAPYFKAVTGAVVAALAVLATSLDNGAISAQEGVYAAIAFFTGLGAVYAIPNRDPKARVQDQSVQPPEAGITALGLVVAVLVIFLILGLVSRF